MRSALLDQTVGRLYHQVLKRKPRIVFQVLFQILYVHIPCESSISGFVFLLALLLLTFGVLGVNIRSLVNHLQLL